MIVTLQLKFYKVILRNLVLLSILNNIFKSFLKNVLNAIRIGRGLSKFNKLIMRGDSSATCVPDY
jgi:hypothetical protein